MTKRVAVPWFTPEHWDRLTAVTNSNLCSFDEFLQRTGDGASAFRAQSIEVDLKAIDVDRFIAQCELRGFAIRGAAADDVLPWLQALDPDLLCVREDPPRHRRTRRHAALFERYQELYGAALTKWQACWESGVQVRELEFDGERHERLMEMAKNCHMADELDHCEQLLDEAEQLMVRQ